MSQDVDWETVMRQLAERPRRRLLVSLLEDNPQADSVSVPGDVVVTEDEERALQTEFVHVHLPRLAAAGFIEWDEEAHEVTKGPAFEDIRPVLELLHAHRDELLDGWL